MNGFWAGVAAYTIWGLVPIYWKLLKHVPAIEVLGQRIVWSLVVLVILVAARRRGRSAFSNVSRRVVGLYAIAACAGVIPNANGAPTPGLLTGLLSDAAGNGSSVASTAPAGREASNAIGVMDWFNAAADRASAVIQRLGLDPHAVQASTKPKGLPLLAATR